jgi:hypothetical protein
VKLHLSAVGRVFRIDRIRKQKTALGVMARDGAGLAEVVDSPDGVRVRIGDGKLLLPRARCFAACGTTG